MNKRSAGKVCRFFAAVLAAVFIVALPLQAQVLSKASRPFRMRASAPPKAQGVAPDGFANAVIFATNSVHLEQGSDVLSGDVIVNDASPGPTLDSQKELTIGLGTTTPAGFSLKADSIKVKQSAVVNATLFCNDLDDGSGTVSCQPGGLSLPVFDPAELPACVAEDPRPDAQDVTVLIGGSAVLPEGHYRDIVVKQNGTLTFSGGDYTIRSIDMGKANNLLFSAPTTLHISGRFDTDEDSFIGPSAGSGLAGRDILIIATGINGGTGNLGATPKAAQVGLRNTVAANFCVPNGTLWLRQGSNLTGSFRGKDVDLGINATVVLDSFYANQPPTANGQAVSTSADAPLLITLTGSDPEGGDLDFSIVSGQGPTQGTLSSITHITPDPIPVPPEQGGGFVQPPITSALVTYTPTPGDPVDAEDSFTFAATDPEGAMGTAVVTINPFDPSPSPAAPTDVSVLDVSAETTTDTAVTIGFSAGACPGSTLVFAVESLPANGTLSDGGVDIEGPLPQNLAGPSVVFTPSSSFTGVTSFEYSATDTAPGCTGATSDTGVVTIDISTAADPAPDQQLSTLQNTPIQITLGTENPESPSAPLKVARVTAGLPSTALPLPGATIAGNVSDANGDGLGDGKDNLPGSAPVLIAAGVDVNLSTGPVTWTLSNVTFDDNGVASGTFTYDASTETVSSWSISVSGGTTTSFPVEMYTPSNSTVSVFCSVSSPGSCPATQEKTIMFTIDIPSQSNDRQLRITPQSPLTAAGGNIPINLNTAPVGNPSGSVECFNCSPFRRINGGSLAATSLPQGIFRLQIEWDVTSLPTDPNLIEACEVTLTTNRGSVDSLNTSFVAGTGPQDGLLTVSDFQAPADTGTTLAVMPVFGTQGVDGTFSFPVTAAVKTARGAGLTHFSIRGRVDESLAGSGFQRGLQIHSTASGNLSAGTEPQLVCTSNTSTGTISTWAIKSLPTPGVLLDPNGALAFVNQSFTSQPTLTFYSPTAGTFNFSYELVRGSLIDSGLITIVVTSGDECLLNGRRVACAVTMCSDGIDNDGDFVPAVLDKSGQLVTPAKGGVDWDGINGQFPADPSCSGPTDDDEFPVDP